MYLGRSRMAEFRCGQGGSAGAYCIHHFFFFFKQKVGEVLKGRLFGDYKEGSDLVCLGDLFNSG